MAFARQLHPAHFHPGRNSIRVEMPSGQKCHPGRISIRVGFPSGQKIHPAACRHFHPDVSHPESGYCHLHPAPHPPPNDIRNSGSGWERKRFNFLDQPCPDPPWHLPGSLQTEGRMLHSCSVLMKLPDICDRHFEIFWDILLQIFDV